MSQYYDVGDQTLWNPSNGASRLFMSQVSVYQAELGLPAGFTEDGGLKDVQAPAAPVSSEGTWAAALQYKSRELARVMAA